MRVTHKKKEQMPRVKLDGTVKKPPGPAAVDFGEETKHFFIRNLPVRVREAAKLQARMHGITLSEFTTQALEEKLTRSRDQH
jgi:hypothetical protein